jgi:hypothetical protein
MKRFIKVFELVYTDTPTAIYINPNQIVSIKINTESYNKHSCEISTSNNKIYKVIETYEQILWQIQ